LVVEKKHVGGSASSRQVGVVGRGALKDGDAEDGGVL
jgi:hypothetical protein